MMNPPLPERGDQELATDYALLITTRGMR